jgi:hypothetical protein
MDDNTQDPGTSTSGEQAQQPSLQLSDLVLALQTIQAAAQRGAVRADEMSTIGGLHDRLFAFLEAQGAIKRPEQGAPNA